LLVVVAVITVLLSILLPSLRGAREAARAAVCGQNMRQFANGLGIYNAENDDWIPGYNTSGVANRALFWKSFSDDTVFNSPKMPVQPHDWMTPIIAPMMEITASWADRYYFLLDEFRCPSQNQSCIAWGGGTAAYKNMMQELEPLPAISYLMPVYFQYVGRREDGRPLATVEDIGWPVSAVAADENWDVRVETYIPRLTRVGRQAARKIFVADGTRYLDFTGILDIDPSPVPTYFGSFSSSGAWRGASTAYGVKHGSLNWDNQSVGGGSSGDGKNLGLSYRHGGGAGNGADTAQNNKGQINALFFDGHVARLNDRESRTPEFWYPTGAEVTTPGGGMTATNVGDRIP
jgi:prepilin-type processing-associated H-X9-DG protein